MKTIHGEGIWCPEAFFLSLRQFVSHSRMDYFQKEGYASKEVTIGAWGWVIIAICAGTMVFIMTWYRQVTAFSDPAQFYGILLSIGLAGGSVAGYRHELGNFFKGFPLMVALIFGGIIGIALALNYLAPSIFSAFALPLSSQEVPVVSIGWVALFYFSGGGAAETAFFQLFLFNGFAKMFMLDQRFDLKWFLLADFIVSAGFFVPYHFAVQFFFPNLWPIAPLSIWIFFLEAFLSSFLLFNPIFWASKRFDAIAFGHGSYDLFWTLLRFYLPKAQAGFGIVGF